MLHRIENASFESDREIRLSFADGRRGTISVDLLTRTGGVLNALEDPSIFKQGTIGPQGRCLQWPGDIEFCADALWQVIQEPHKNAPAGAEAVK